MTKKLKRKTPQITVAGIALRGQHDPIPIMFPFRREVFARPWV